MEYLSAITGIRTSISKPALASIVSSRRAACASRGRVVSIPWRRRRAPVRRHARRLVVRHHQWRGKRETKPYSGDRVFSSHQVLSSRSDHGTASTRACCSAPMIFWNRKALPKGRQRCFKQPARFVRSRARRSRRRRSLPPQQADATEDLRPALASHRAAVPPGPVPRRPDPRVSASALAPTGSAGPEKAKGRARSGIDGAASAKTSRMSDEAEKFDTI
jgi:hypothetical protein